MKKILSLVIAIFCLSSVTVFASPVKTVDVEDKTGLTSLSPTAIISFEENLEGLYYDGEYFTQFNSNNIEIDGYDELVCTVSLSDSQKQKLSTVNLCINLSRNIIRVDYHFKNGTTFSASYLKHEYISEYDRVMSQDWEYGEIDFMFPNDNQIRVEQEMLLGNEVNLFIDNKNFTDTYPVYAVFADNSIKVIKGNIVVKDSKHYYVDFANAQISDGNDFNIFDYSNILAFEIADEALIEQIKEGIKKNYGTDYGFFDDDKFTNAIADVMLTLMFFIFPLAIFILFLVLAIRSKTKYKKLFRAIYISAVIIMIIFIVLSLIL